MKTKKQIKNFILKTLLPYKENPEIRGAATKGVGCMYLNEETGNKCALGRWMKKGRWQYCSQGVLGLVRQLEQDSLTLNDILLKDAAEMKFEIDVWHLMQMYHDNLIREANILAQNSVRQMEKVLDIKLEELYV